MFKTLFSKEFAYRRHRDAPFAEERDRYLRYCLSVGATRNSLLGKACSLRRLAGQLGAAPPPASICLSCERPSPGVCRDMSMPP